MEIIILILVILGIQGSYQKAQKNKKAKRDSAAQKEAHRQRTVADYYARKNG